jgi:hypothetical protein
MRALKFSLFADEITTGRQRDSGVGGRPLKLQG